MEKIGRWLFVIFIYLVILGLCYGTAVIGQVGDWVEKLGGSIAVSLAIYFLVVARTMFIKPKPNTAIVMSNTTITEYKKVKLLKPSKGPTTKIIRYRTGRNKGKKMTQVKGWETKYTGYKKSRAQREVAGGWHPIYWWDEEVHTVDLVKGLQVLHCDETFTLKNKKNIRLQYQIEYEPLVGFLPNHVKWKKEDIDAKVRARPKKFFQGHIGKMTDIQFDKDEMDNLTQASEDLFGGPSFIDVDERAMGIRIIKITVNDISMTEAAEEAQNFEQEMEPFRRVARNLYDDFDGALPPGESLKWTSLLMSAKKDGKPINYTELGGLISPAQGKKGNR